MTALALYLYLGGVITHIGIGANDAPGPSPYGAHYERAKAEWDAMSAKRQARINNRVIIVMALIWPAIIPFMIWDVVVKHLIKIRDTGSVSGNVQYGALAMEVGGNLSAEVRNVPPKLAGDLDLTVARGRSVLITLEDLHAVDPDDEAKDLVFSVSNPRNGFVTLAGAPGRPAAQFTQADLEAGKVSFTHDGSPAPTASFEVVVADHTGATSGRPQTVKVTVR